MEWLKLVSDVTRVQDKVITTTRPSNQADSRTIERLLSYRLLLGWIALVCSGVATIAFDWDAQWHVNIGRDGFWTPPHLMFYGSATFCGLVCIVEVLTETFFYYRHHLDNKNSRGMTTALFFFRGPVGFELCGFGLLVVLISAPLDDYWHRIYGIDVRIWSPFHVMLLLGMLMANLGIIYVFASLMNNQNRKRTNKKEFLQSGQWHSLIKNLRNLLKPTILGLALAILMLLSRYCFLMAETEIAKFSFMGFDLPAYSLIIAPVSLLLIALVKSTRLPGIATFAGLMFLVFWWGDILFINLGIRHLAVEQGLSIRPGSLEFHIIPVTYPPTLFLVGMLIDIMYYYFERWESLSCFGTIALAMFASAGGGLLIFLTWKPWEEFNDVARELAAKYPAFSKSILQSLVKPDYWQALPLVLLISGVAGLFGLAFAVSLKYTES